MMKIKFEKEKIRIEIITHQSDIIYKKLLIFSAIAGSSWLYGIKFTGYFGFVIWMVFTLSVIGIVVNLTKMGLHYKELEDIKNG